MMEQSRKPLINLAGSLSALPARALLAAVGGLQLMPENGSRILRLEVLAHVAGALPDRPGTQRLSTSSLRQMCNTGVIGEGAIPTMEDPNSQPLTDSVAFHGGAYTVFPGIADDSAGIMRLLTHALFHFSPGDPRRDRFSTECYFLIRAVLAVSDVIARRAGLGRGVEPADEGKGKVVVPSVAEVERLSRAVTFTDDELSSLAEDNGFDLRHLGRLTCPAGGVDLASYAADDCELTRRPLVRGDGWVVAPAPGLLLSAARHAITELAREYGRQADLVRQFSLATWNQVAFALDMLGCRDAWVEGPDRGALPENVQEGFFSFDTDKTLYALLVTDDLSGYDPACAFGSWGIRHLEEALVGRIAEAVAYHEREMAGSERLMVLLSVASLGRSVTFGGDALSDGDFDFLHASPHDLEVMCFAESGNPLALWKYARASERARRSTAILSFGALPEFALYRGHRHSYYVSDDYVPDRIALASDMGVGVRREVASKVDRHAVLGPDRQTLIEVMLFRGDRRLPVYAPIAGPEPLDRIALYVEGLPVPVWVVGPRREKIGRLGLSQLYLNFADTITYWLDQLSPELEGLEMAGGKTSGGPPNLIIELALPEDEDWEHLGDAPLPDVPGPTVDVALDVRHGAARLTIHSEALRLCASATNGGERLLMADVLRALLALLPLARTPTDEEALAMVERRMPLGEKKMFLVLNLDRAFELDDRDLPRFRKLQDADIEELLDELGEHLTGAAGMKRGRVSPDKRTELVRDHVVPFFYREVQRLVAGLRPDGLLEELVRRHEAGLRYAESTKMSAPTRLACFDFDPAMPKRIQEEMGEATSAAIANRFLIEYVTARPPSGGRRMSLATYDRLLAAAHHVVSFGFLSDIVHYRLADVGLSMLGSGRLGRDMASYEAAEDAFRPLFGASLLTDAQKGFARYWESSGRGEEATGDPGDGVDPSAEEAMRAEFGFSMSEFAALARFLMGEVLGGESAVAAARLSDLRRRAGSALGWDEGRCAAALDVLSLGPRPDFLKPPSPYKGFDVWPWRFNRRMSYIRRPLLLQGTGDDAEVLWGARNLYEAGGYLTNLLLSGRLPAHGERQSAEMSTYQGRANDHRGARFEDRVERALKGAGGYVVRRTVKKVGALKLGEIGDIDILAADPRRRALYVMECKDLSFAKTPYEMGQQIESLYVPDPKKRSAVGQALRKADWVRANLGAGLTWLGLSHAAAGWRVVPLVVTDQRMLTPYLLDVPVTILPLEDVPEFLSK